MTNAAVSKAMLPPFLYTTKIKNLYAGFQKILLKSGIYNRLCALYVRFDLFQKLIYLRSRGGFRRGLAGVEIVKLFGVSESGRQVGAQDIEHIRTILFVGTLAFGLQVFTELGRILFPVNI